MANLKDHQMSIKIQTEIVRGFAVRGPDGSFSGIAPRATGRAGEVAVSALVAGKERSIISEWTDGDATAAPLVSWLRDALEQARTEGAGTW